jgi:integral membrane protein (TIGR01906 family)
MNFYKEKFSEYKVQNNVPEAAPINEKVINFIRGKSENIPNEFNEREKQHLLDVRQIIGISTIALYVFIIVFIVLLVISALILKANNYIMNFVGKVLVFGGFLTIILAAILFLFISSDFSAAFGSFHALLFEKGTYVFDPAKEMIVRLYPEQIFMDLGVDISKGIIISSAVIILAGLFLLFRSKNKKNKNTRK